MRTLFKIALNALAVVGIVALGREYNDRKAKENVDTTDQTRTVPTSK